MCLILEVKPKFVNQMFLSGLIVLAIALLFKVKGNSRITIALYAFWNSPLAIRLVWLFLSIICIVLLSAFNDPVFCTGSDNNGGTTPTHISTSISDKSVSDTPISLNFNFTTTLKTGATAAGLGYGIAKVVKAVPPASKAGVAVALSAVVGATVVASKALSRGSNNSNNSSISEFALKSKTGGDGASSVIEFISDEQQLVFACIIFCGVALWMFVGLLLNLALLRFGDWILPRIADRPILMRLYRYYSVSSTTLIVILSLIIIYSLAFTLFILYRLY
jgi:hypothetical protein|nr:hypothetical protein GlirM_p20 [Rhizophagus irregularis]AJK91354.1 hypothetical protein [Rhizophagus aggregatus]ADM94795.1 hypothetical protein [Rhizophagus irregularis]AFN42446.1 hypothetical protein [Rhizophagus irregularis]AFN42508.1 hypothetical protein [Rhizophagus irregularis]AGA14219.1 hypothetical protein [Rhizophagus irregularis]